MPVSATFPRLAEYNFQYTHPMKRFLPALVAAIFICPLGLLAKPSLAEYLPADSWAVIEIEDFVTLKKEVEDDLSDLFGDEEASSNKGN